VALHGLKDITVGVPTVELTSEFYVDFGLSAGSAGALASTDGGQQLKLVPSAVRRLVGLTIRADDHDDLAHITARASRHGVQAQLSQDGASVQVTDPWAGIAVTVSICPRLLQPPAPELGSNGPGRVGRSGRADVVERASRVCPRRLGHCVLGSPYAEELIAFFTDVIGFQVSDRVRGEGTFLRCSTDHHNLLINHAPVTFLHHTAWQVDDIDEVGRGAAAMIEADPSRHVWGFGRHCIGSNFFWYLRDPAGNFAEYYSDLDVIPEDTIWEPGIWEGARGLYLWGPPPPSSFIKPDDLADLMISGHSRSR